MGALAVKPGTGRSSSDLTTKYYISFFIFEAALSSRDGCKIIPHSIPHLLKSGAINIFLLPEVVVGSGQQDLAWWIPCSDRKISEGRAPSTLYWSGWLVSKRSSKGGALLSFPGMLKGWSSSLVRLYMRVNAWTIRVVCSGRSQSGLMMGVIAQKYQFSGPIRGTIGPPVLQSPTKYDSMKAVVLCWSFVRI